jgi:predicted nucleotidyltransferase
VSDSIEEQWLSALSDWARGVPSITKAWVFGSRVKGTDSLSSDLDVAVFLEPDDGKVLADWILNAKIWRASAQSTVGEFPTIDLQLASPEFDDVVWPAVNEHGKLFYKKCQ